MAFTVSIGSTDITQYVQAALEEFNPFAPSAEPQFAGNSLTDGDLFISMTTRNREWTIPLLIVATSNDALASTVRTINKALTQGAQVTYQEEGASLPTYFDLETGRLDAQYRYQRNRQGMGKFTLKLWARPYGHTGTSRIVATAVSDGHFTFPVPSMGLVGDAPAELTIEATTAASGFGVVSWGYHPDPSFTPLHKHPGTLNGLDSAIGAATTLGDALSYYGTVVALGTEGGFVQISPTQSVQGAPSAYRGQWLRVFGAFRILAHANGATADSVAAPSAFPAIAWAETTADGYTLSETSPIKLYGASTYLNASRYHLYDLGQLYVSRDTLSAAATYGPYVTVRLAGTNIATSVSSMPLRIEALYTVPVGGLAVAPTSSTLADTYSALRVDGANASVTARYGPQMRPVGEYPRSDSGASGVVSGIAIRRSRLPQASGGRNVGLSVLAREQFQFLR